MNLTLSDISIRRPVFATVMSLLLIILGMLAFSRLPLRELPNTDPPIVSVETGYRGAAAAVVESRITEPLENVLAGLEGIESITSSSQNGRSSISIEFNLNRDVADAANDVRDAVSRAINDLPREADRPQVAKVDSDAEPVMWLNLASNRMNLQELSDYADRYVVDRFSAIDGVARVQIGGAQRYAMRLEIDPNRLAARGLTIVDIINALERENIELPAGRIESATRDFTLRIERQFIDADAFANLPLSKGVDGHVVRLGEVATITLDTLEKRVLFRGNGEPQLGLGVIKSSTANALEVADAVKREVNSIAKSLPEGTQLLVAYDTAIFVQAAVSQVFRTLLESMLLVIAVIVVFLGSFRAAIIPAVTVPICLIASFAALYLFGFTINLLTLLALVLAIGLVVDDAIVVLENCQRRLDLGEPRLLAASLGTRQVRFAVIATTVVLVSVFLPIAAMQGNIGRLFRELAVALACAVAISGFVALTLSPMMCSKYLKAHTKDDRFAMRVEHYSARLSARYISALNGVLAHPWRMLTVFGLSIIGIVLLYRNVPRELAPAEDRGSFFVQANAVEGAGFDYLSAQMKPVEDRLLKLVESGEAMRVNVRAPRGGGGVSSEEMHTGMAIVLLTPWNQRERDSQTIMEEVRKDLNQLPGIRANPQMRQALARGFGQPLQFVIGGPDYGLLVQWRDQLLQRLSANPKLLNLDHDYKETRPQLRIQINESRAADLGVSARDIATALEVTTGGRRVTTFTRDGQEYEVILQGSRANRATPTHIGAIRVRASGGELVPLSNLVDFKEIAEPGSLNRFNRLRAITVSAGLAPGYTLGEALAFVEQSARESLPATAATDTKGEARELKKSSSGNALTFALALLVVFLVLAAQFESFLHPLVILLTVPLAMFGALLGLWIFGSTINLFSQIGIVMLVGLAAKNGVLIVEFANQLRDAGRTIEQAVIESASVRLRPILMTSVATMLGALPLMLSQGAGSASNRSIGIVVVFGVAISTVLSLFVVPLFYRWVAPYTRSPESVKNEIEALQQTNAYNSDHA